MDIAFGIKVDITVALVNHLSIEENWRSRGQPTRSVLTLAVGRYHHISAVTGLVSTGPESRSDVTRECF
ncbi:hypothetical protein J6590_019521 [Homalodisca vitripennis]|nr:hypothetical protein J6590_019521 [Homalodisca vitripennis]